MASGRREFLAVVGSLTGGLVAGSAAGDSQGSAVAAGQADGYAPLGSVDIAGARDTAVAGEVAYVATGDGFVTVDVSGENPSVLAERRGIPTSDGGQLTGIWDLWPSGDRLAVGGPAQFRRNQQSGVGLFDVSDPTGPEQVAFHPTDHHIHNLHFSDNVLYLPARDRPMSLVMVDVSGDDPVEVGRWSPFDADDRWADIEPPLRVLHDVFVRDGTAYLPYWDAGTWLVDVSDPTDPTAYSRVGDYSVEQVAAVGPGQADLVARTPDGADHYAQVDETGSVLAVGKETWAIEDRRGTFGETGRRVGGASGITLYNVSDPTSPEELSSIDPPVSVDQRTSGWFTTAHDFDFRDGRLFTSWYYGGVAVYDVSDPADPTEVSRWQDPRTASFWTARAVDDERFVASSVDVSSVLGGRAETREGLYVFPNEAGSQADPPLLTDWPEDVFGPEPDDRSPVNRTAASVDRLVDVRDPDDERGDRHDGPDSPGEGSGDRNGTDGTPAMPREGSTNGSGPGLGVGTALAGVGGYLLARRAGLLSDSDGDG